MRVVRVVRLLIERTGVIHSGPLRDAPDRRRVYLRIARMHVFNAIGAWSYALTNIDKAFLKVADELLSE